MFGLQKVRLSRSTDWRFLPQICLTGPHSRRSSYHFEKSGYKGDLSRLELTSTYASLFDLRAFEHCGLPVCHFRDYRKWRFFQSVSRTCRLRRNTPPFILSSVYPTDNPIMSRSPSARHTGETSPRGIKRNAHDPLDETDAAVHGSHSPQERSFTPDGSTAKDTASRKVNKRSRAGCLTCRKRRVNMHYVTLFAPLMIGEMRRVTSYLRWMRGTSGDLRMAGPQAGTVTAQAPASYHEL